MLLGDLFLILALVFYAADFVALIAGKVRLALCSLITTVSLSIFASSLFSWYFATDNFALNAVYEHSSRALSPLLKLSASWTGSGGSLLLWLLMTAVATLALRLRNRLCKAASSVCVKPSHELVHS